MKDRKDPVVANDGLHGAEKLNVAAKKIIKEG
jgi:hypothetical protein